MGKKDHLRVWWQPVLEMNFDDPQQKAPSWTTTNNVILKTPFPGVQIKAFALVKGSRIGVFVSGPQRSEIQKYLKSEKGYLLRELPDGTKIRVGDCSIAIDRFDLESDDDKRAWIMKTMNAFVNVLCPRLRKWHEEERRKR